MSLAHGPDAVSPDGRIVERLRSMSYIEMYGEAMFGLMLEHGGALTPEQRRKIEACRLLEVEMSELLCKHLALELGLPIGALSHRPLTASEKKTIHEQSWQARMEALETVASVIVAAARELKTAYSRRQPTLCNTLLAHALMLRDFAHHEAEGDVDRSLGGVVSLLGADAREALLAFQR
jgi:hypothetical protein